MISQLISQIETLSLKEISTYSSGRGTHVIVISIEKYSEELKQELIKKIR